MLPKIYILGAVVIVLLLAYTYAQSCEEEKAAKLELYKATRDQLGDAELAVMNCNQAVQLIETEIAKLRDVVIQKKVANLRMCKTTFDAKIATYKTVYRAAYSREATTAYINQMKRRLGINI